MPNEGGGKGEEAAGRRREEGHSPNKHKKENSTAGKQQEKGQRQKCKRKQISERIADTEVEAEGVKSGGDIEIGIDGTGAVGSAVLVVTIGLIGDMDSDT